VWSSWIFTLDFNTGPKIASRTILYFWIVLGCRLVKYIEHFARYPGDAIYVPIIPLFGYYHSIFIKLRAMFSLQVTTWGSREGADADDDQRLIRLPPYTESSGSSYSSTTQSTQLKPTNPVNGLSLPKASRQNHPPFYDIGPLWRPIFQPHLPRLPKVRQNHYLFHFFSLRTVYERLIVAFRIPVICAHLRGYRSFN